MNKQEENIMLIWQYIDNTCTEKERLSIENLLKSDEQFSALYNEQMALHTALQQEELEQPSMRFAKNVMEKIAELNTQTVFTKQYLNNKIIYSIGFIFVAMMVWALVYAGMNIDFTASSAMQSNYNFDSTINKISNNAKTFNWILMIGSAMLLVLFIDKLYQSRKKVGQ